jgi:hypothetical protein
MAGTIPALPAAISVGEKETLAKTLDNYEQFLRKLQRNDEADKVAARSKALTRPKTSAQ